MKVLVSFFFLFVINFVISQSFYPDPYSDQFSTCCKEKGVSALCQQHCNFEFHPDEVIGAFANGTCNLETDTAPYYQCLQNSKNMTNCCIEFGVVTLEKPRHCLDLCDGSTAIIYDKKYVLCEPVQSSIMSCGIDSYYDNSKMLHKREGELPTSEDPPYTKFEVGFGFSIYGTLSCDVEGQTVGNEGTVILMEYDPLTFNDEFGRVKITDNSFEITYEKSIWDGDFPDLHYEFYLIFKNVCGKWRDQKSGIVLPDLNVSYVILDHFLNTYTHVPYPFPGLAKQMSENRFRFCWFFPAQEYGCVFKEYIDAKRQAEKFKLKAHPDGPGPGK